MISRLIAILTGVILIVAFIYKIQYKPVEIPKPIDSRTEPVLDDIKPHHVVEMASPIKTPTIEEERDEAIQKYGYTLLDKLLKVPEVHFYIKMTDMYLAKKSDEEGRAGSLVSYDINPLKGDCFEGYPELLFFNNESMRAFAQSCQEYLNSDDAGSGEGFCDTGDYPTVEQSNRIKNMIKLGEVPERSEGARMKTMNNQKYFIQDSKRYFGKIRTYSTFIDNVWINIWMIMGCEDFNKFDQQANEFVSNLIIKKY